MDDEAMLGRNKQTAYIIIILYIFRFTQIIGTHKLYRHVHEPLKSLVMTF